MKKIIGIYAVSIAASLAAMETGQADNNSTSGDPQFEITRVTDRVHVIYGPLDLPDEHNRGFRNNPVIVLTRKGTVVFDPGGSAWAGEQVAAAAKTLSSDPVVAVFNSHAHGDHWLGNEGIRRVYPEAKIYGHPLMKKRVEGGDGHRWLEQIERLTKGTAGGTEVIAPGETVADGDLIRIGGMAFRIHHTGLAHTDNDIMIEIVEERTLFTGDVVRNGLLGLMDSDSNFAGNIAAIDSILAMDFEHYIPGHGPVGGRPAVIAYRTYLDTLLTKVRTLYADGLTDYEMKPAVGEALSYFSGWEGFHMRLGAHVSRAYLEVETEEF